MGSVTASSDRWACEPRRWVTRLPCLALTALGWFLPTDRHVQGAAVAQDAIEWPRQSSQGPSELAGGDGTGRGLRVLVGVVWLTIRELVPAI